MDVEHEDDAGPVDADLSARATALYLGGYGPIPIRTGQKAPEPGGFQGEKNGLPSFADWYAVVLEHPADWGNLGVRLPADVVGIDVDAYDGKDGKTSWEALTAGLPFPPTVVVSARFSPGYDGLSGIRLYRLPDSVRQGDLWGAHRGIELLRFGHRYLLAPGSAHPSGSSYEAFDVRAREFLDYLPSVGALPVLSPAQALRLTKTGAPWATERQGRGTGAPGTPARAPSTGQRVLGPGRPQDGAALGGVACPYLARLAAEAVHDIQTGESRHDRMTRATYAILAASAEGHRGAAVALADVGNAFIAAVTDRDDPDMLRAEVRRAIQQAQDKIEPLDPMLQACCPGPVPPSGTTQPQEGIWKARPWLAWCDRTGRARGISRYALVGALLARASAEISPQVKVDSPVGHGRTELGLFTFLLGGSGTSKTSANGTVRAAWPWTAPEIRLGSGEGLAAAYTKRDTAKDPETGKRTNVAVRHEWRRFAWVDEYASLVSLKERAGQTLSAELRSAWSGERLGMDYRAEETRLPVEAGTYRLAIAAGIQPGLTDHVFAGADVGDLQRWVWFSATDAELADADAPAAFVPLDASEICLPAAVCNNAVPFDLMTEPGLLLMPISTAIRDRIWTDHRARQAGVAQDHDAHRNQTRLRLSGLCALLDGRLSVADDDWELAGALLLVSDGTRAQVEAHLRADRQTRLLARGEANATIASGEAEANTKRLAGRVARSVALHGPQTKRQLRDRINLRDREWYAAGVDRAIELGWLVPGALVADATGKTSTSYERGPSWTG